MDQEELYLVIEHLLGLFIQVPNVLFEFSSDLFSFEALQILYKFPNYSSKVIAEYFDVNSQEVLFNYITSQSPSSIIIPDHYYSSKEISSGNPCSFFPSDSFISESFFKQPQQLSSSSSSTNPSTIKTPNDFFLNDKRKLSLLKPICFLSKTLIKFIEGFKKQKASEGVELQAQVLNKVFFSYNYQFLALTCHKKDSGLYKYFGFDCNIYLLTNIEIILVIIVKLLTQVDVNFNNLLLHFIIILSLSHEICQILATEFLIFKSIFEATINKDHYLNNYSIDEALCFKILNNLSQHLVVSGLPNSSSIKADARNYSYLEFVLEKCIQELINNASLSQSQLCNRLSLICHLYYYQKSILDKHEYFSKNSTFKKLTKLCVHFITNTDPKIISSALCILCFIQASNNAKLFSQIFSSEKLLQIIALLFHLILSENPTKHTKASDSSQILFNIRISFEFLIKDTRFVGHLKHFPKSHVLCLKILQKFTTLLKDSTSDPSCDLSASGLRSEDSDVSSDNAHEEFLYDYHLHFVIFDLLKIIPFNSLASDITSLRSIYVALLEKLEFLISSAGMAQCLDYLKFYQFIWLNELPNPGSDCVKDSTKNALEWTQLFMKKRVVFSLFYYFKEPCQSLEIQKPTKDSAEDKENHSTMQSFSSPQILVFSENYSKATNQDKTKTNIFLESSDPRQTCSNSGTTSSIQNFRMAYNSKALYYFQIETQWVDQLFKLVSNILKLNYDDDHSSTANNKNYCSIFDSLFVKIQGWTCQILTPLFIQYKSLFYFKGFLNKNKEKVLIQGLNKIFWHGYVIIYFLCHLISLCNEFKKYEKPSDLKELKSLLSQESLLWVFHCLKDFMEFSLANSLIEKTWISNFKIRLESLVSYFDPGQYSSSLQLYASCNFLSLSIYSSVIDSVKDSNVDALFCEQELGDYHHENGSLTLRSLRKEIDQIKYELNEESRKKETLVSKIISLQTKEHSEMKTHWKDIIAQFNQKEIQYENLYKENKEFLANEKNLLSELHCLKEKNESLKMKMEDSDNLYINNVNDLTFQIYCLKNDLELLVKNKGLLEDEFKALEKSISHQQSENGVLVLQNQSLTQENQTLQQSFENAQCQNKEVANQIKILLKEHAESISSLQLNHAHEKTALDLKLKTVSEESMASLFTLNSQLELLQSDYQKLKLYSEDQSADFKCLESILEQSNVEKQALSESYKALLEENSSLCTQIQVENTEFKKLLQVKIQDITHEKKQLALNLNQWEKILDNQVQALVNENKASTLQYEELLENFQSSKASLEAELASSKLEHEKTLLELSKEKEQKLDIQKNMAELKELHEKTVFEMSKTIENLTQAQQNLENSLAQKISEANAVLSSFEQNTKDEIKALVCKNELVVENINLKLSEKVQAYENLMGQFENAQGCLKTLTSEAQEFKTKTQAILEEQGSRLALSEGLNIELASANKALTEEKSQWLQWKENSMQEMSQKALELENSNNENAHLVRENERLKQELQEKAELSDLIQGLANKLKTTK